MKSRFVFFSILLIMQGCTVGPKYQKPNVELTSNWESILTNNFPVDLSHWWSNFNDEILDALINEAAKQNYTLKEAYAKISEARAERGVIASEKYPQLNAAVDFTFEDWHLKASPPELQFPTPKSLFLGALDASWEIDLFGKIRRSVESATASLEATIENYRDVYITLLAEIAANYIELRTLQARINFSEKNLKIQGKTLEIAKERYKYGDVPETTVVRAESNFYNSQAQVPSFYAALAESKHRIAVLLGKQPGTLEIDLDTVQPIPKFSDAISLGIPRDLIRQRPDIREAERNLASRTADIGVATADLYPQFSLKGSFSGASIPLTKNGFFDFTRWNIGPSVLWSLLNGGKIRSNIKVNQAKAIQSFQKYQETVLQAVEEVENSISFIYQEVRRKNSLKEAVTATEKSVELISLAYFEGLIDFQIVLDSERFLFTQQDQYAQSEGQVVQFAVSLYKALGGGWNE